jgi:alkylation response protein AidB-like acyl-CoA dehydrogenase
LIEPKLALMTISQASKPQPLLRKAFPPNGLSARENGMLAVLEQAIEVHIAPKAAANDEKGRYPSSAIAALKRSGLLKTAVPAAFGGLGFSSRFSLEAQLRLAIADSAVAQIFKIHDELTREISVYSTAEFRSSLARKLLDEDAILGLAVAESGLKVNDPWTTVALPQTDGGFIIEGRKIYTTGAAEADYIVSWAFNPEAEGVATNPLLGVQGILVPANTAGVTIHRDWDAIGQRATDSGTITFKQVRTKPNWSCNVPGKAPLSHASLRYQAGFAAVLIGLGIGALRAAIPFVTEKSRPWPSAGVSNAADDPFVRRLAGELTAELAAAYVLTLATGDLLDAHERGEIDRTALAAPIYAAKAIASRAGVRATSEIFALMGTRSVARANGFDRFWRNARTISLHDPVDWKHSELGQHVLTGWDPPPGIYQ